MTYRVRCKRKQRMPPWAMNVGLGAMAKQIELYGWREASELPLPRLFPKRRAWPAVSRKDARKQVFAQWYADAKASGQGLYFPLGDGDL